MQKTIKRTFKNNFTQIPNAILLSKELSLKAKGLCAYLLSKPDDWVFTKLDILNDIKEGVDAFDSAITELTSKGFIVKKIVRNSEQKFIGTKYEVLDKL